MDYLYAFIDTIYDCLEDFVGSVSIPSAKYIIDTFKVSLIFLLVSIVCRLFDVWCFVSWQEALTCSIILLIISLIDTSTRGKISKSIKTFKNSAQEKVHNKLSEVGKHGSNK